MAPAKCQRKEVPQGTWNDQFHKCKQRKVVLDLLWQWRFMNAGSHHVGHTFRKVNCSWIMGRRQSRSGCYQPPFETPSTAPSSRGMWAHILCSTLNFKDYKKINHVICEQQLTVQHPGACKCWRLLASTMYNQQEEEDALWMRSLHLDQRSCSRKCESSTVQIPRSSDKKAKCINNFTLRLHNLIKYADTITICWTQQSWQYKEVFFTRQLNNIAPTNGSTSVSTCLKFENVFKAGETLLISWHYEFVSNWKPCNSWSTLSLLFVWSQGRITSMAPQSLLHCLGLDMAGTGASPSVWQTLEVMLLQRTLDLIIPDWMAF